MVYKLQLSQCNYHWFHFLLKISSSVQRQSKPDNMKVTCLCIALFCAAAYAQGPALTYPTLKTQAFPTSNNYAYPANKGNVMSSYNGYRRNAASTKDGYQSNTNNLNSYLLSMMMGMDEGNDMATLGMMMNSRQGNSMLPFYMMNQGYEDMLPMMAFMNRGNRRGQRMNPFVMMTLHDVLN